MCGFIPFLVVLLLWGIEPLEECVGGDADILPFVLVTRSGGKKVPSRRIMTAGKIFQLARYPNGRSRQELDGSMTIIR